MNTLPRELLVSATMIIGLALFHLFGLMTLLKTIRFHIEHLKSPWIAFDRVAVPMVMVLGLFVIHGTEVLAYTVLFRVLVFPGWEEALYAATTAYTTAGTTDFDRHAPWRLVAAQSSLAGMLLIGWSTAFLFATLHRILTTEETHPLPEGAIAVEESEEAATQA
jgi:hypothetical protein